MRDLERRLTTIEKMLQPKPTAPPQCPRIFFYSINADAATLQSLEDEARRACQGLGAHRHTWLPKKIEGSPPRPAETS